MEHALGKFSVATRAFEAYDVLAASCCLALYTLPEKFHGSAFGSMTAETLTFQFGKRNLVKTKRADGIDNCHDPVSPLIQAK
jgi:hypothetical protein